MSMVAWKWLRNFLVGNLCVVVPLWWVVFGWMPTQVKVEMRGTSPVVLVAGETVLAGEEHGKWEEGTVWRFYLREGMEWKELAFRLSEGMDGGDVRQVRLEKWKLLSLGKRGGGLERREGPENDFVFRNPHFGSVGVASGKIPLGLAGLELTLLFLSCWCAKYHHEERWRTLLPSALGISLALTVLMQVALPVQSWLANQSAYPFGSGDLAVAVAWRTMWTLALSVVALCVLAHCFGRWVFGAALAFAGCIYLESGILAAGLPKLDGEWSFFQDKTRKLWDTAVWGVVFALTALGHPAMKKRYGLAALCLLGLVFASMLDAKREEQPDTSRFIVDEFCSIGEVARSVEYSPMKNVLVFIVDSLEREQAHAIMEDPAAGPKLREQFRGFTEYTNNVGACDYSLPAVANLMTGKYPEYSEGSMSAEYYASVFAEESALKDYLDAGYAVYMGTSALGYGYATRKQNGGKTRVQGTIWNVSPEGEQDMTLGEVCRFRWLPFAAKALYGELRELGREERTSVLREDVMYPMLAQGNVRTEATGTFLLMHTEGVHRPILQGRNGERLSRANNTYAGCVEAGIHVLGELGNLLDVLRQKGIHDSAMIVVLADHGCHPLDREEVKTDLPGRGKPFLWVKCPGDTHDFCGNGIPTSHARIASFLREASRGHLTDADCCRLLRNDKRLYRRNMDMGKKWQDWLVDEKGNVSVTTTDKISSEISEKACLQTGVEYSLHISEMAKRLDVEIRLGDAFQMGMVTERPKWWPDAPHMDLAFKVPDRNVRYTVHLGVRVWNSAETGENRVGSQALLRCGGIELALSDGKRKEVVFRGVVPDGEGQMCIEGEREDGFQSNVELTHLRLDKEK